MKVILAALVLIATACQAQQESSVESRRPTGSTTAAEAAAVHKIDIKISGGTYTPASVNVEKGKPVRLHFTRDEKPTCGDEVVFPALNVKRKIEVDKVTAIEITPQQSGDLEFTCGMNMMKGKIVVQ